MRRILRRIWLGLLITAPLLVMLNLALLALRSADWQPEAAIAAAAQYEVEIIRDAYGVPHIYGQRDVDVAFGLSYAHAEDDFETMQQMIPFYRGELARAIGLDGAPIDYLVHWLDVRRHVEENYERVLPPEIRAHLKAYADGLNYYAATHKREADPRLFPITPQDLTVGFSLQHLLFYGFESHVAELFADSPQRELAAAPDAAALTRHIGAAGLPVGSNAFAINGNKSDDGATRIMINSHQPLTGPVAWYEAHVKSGEGWDMHGGVFPGMPFIAKGFNPAIGYGVTVNKPDLVDVYRLTPNPENADEYMLDGAPRAFDSRRHWLKIKLLGNFYLPVPRRLLKAAHGPALETSHGTYALRFAGMGEMRQPVQWMAMNKARNLTDFKKAMAMQAIVSFNFVYADRAGNIYFLHNGRSPRRAAGWDWSKYLPGDRSDLIWDEQISFAEMPQITNPPSGYLLSTNQNPFQVTAANDNLAPSAYPPTLGLQTRMTNRADRGLAMFAEAGRMSEADFIAVKWDKFYAPNSRAMRYVRRIGDMEFAAGSLHEKGQKLLAAWNGETAKDNRHAALGVCLLSEEWKAEQAGKPAPDIGPVYDACLAKLMTAFGRLDPLWAERNRLLRGKTHLPLGGGPDTLRAIYGLPEADGRLKAVAGDGLVVYTAWDKTGKQSGGTVHNFGAASTRPASPHYDDQAPLYAAERFRPVALTRQELLAAPHKIVRLPAKRAW
jgi:penicillin amidase/acyl-homoserine-lactone acylase